MKKGAAYSPESKVVIVVVLPISKPAFFFLLQVYNIFLPLQSKITQRILILNNKSVHLSGVKIHFSTIIIQKSRAKCKIKMAKV